MSRSDDCTLTETDVNLLSEYQFSFNLFSFMDFRFPCEIPI